MRKRRESLSFLSFLPRRERPLSAGKRATKEIGDVWTQARQEAKNSFTVDL